MSYNSTPFYFFFCRVTFFDDFPVLDSKDFCITFENHNHFGSLSMIIEDWSQSINVEQLDKSEQECENSPKTVKNLINGENIQKRVTMKFCFMM